MEQKKKFYMRQYNVLKFVQRLERREMVENVKKIYKNVVKYLY